VTTKKAPKSKSKPQNRDPLAREHRFNYAEAKPNRFARQIRGGSVAVLLDPDVAKVFKDGEAVNAVLRALMATMPLRDPRR